MDVVDWCASPVGKLICSQIILTASIPGSLLICRSLAICLQNLSPLPLGRVSEVRRLLLELDPYGGTDPLGMFPLFLKRIADVLAIHCKCALESGQGANIVQINFSAAINRVNHQGILYKLCSVGIRGSVLSILTQCLSNRSRHVMVDSCRNKLVNVVSGVPHCCVLVLLLFLLYTSEFFSILENKLFGYADDSTLIAVVPFPVISVLVAESLRNEMSDLCQSP